MNFKEESDFNVSSSSLKEIRNFARELFEKVEAAQNVVKHAYKNQPTDDLMKVLINYQDKTLNIELFDKGTAAIPENIKPRNLDDVKAGGLGTFFIGQIMDEVVFKTSKIDWVNHLILIKKF
jgi:serine/threonine-protein kinase RsbW